MLRKVCTGMLALLLGFAGPVLAGFSAGPVYAETANLTVNVNTVDGSRAAVSCTVSIFVDKVVYPRVPTLSAEVTAPGSAVFSVEPGYWYQIKWRQGYNWGETKTVYVEGNTQVSFQLGRLNLQAKNENGGPVVATFVWNYGPKPEQSHVTADVVPGNYEVRARTQGYVYLPTISSVTVEAGETKLIDFVWGIMKVKAIWVPTGLGYEGLWMDAEFAYMEDGATKSDGMFETLINHEEQAYRCKLHKYDTAHVPFKAKAKTVIVSQSGTPPSPVRSNAHAWSVVKWDQDPPVVAKMWDHELRRINLQGSLAPMDVNMTWNASPNVFYGWPKKEMSGLLKPHLFAGTGNVYTFEVHPRAGRYDPLDPRIIEVNVTVPDDPHPGRVSGHTCQFP